MKSLIFAGCAIKVAKGDIFHLSFAPAAGYSPVTGDCCIATKRAGLMRTLIETAVFEGPPLMAGPFLAALLLLVVVLLIGPHRGAAMERAR
ncbi:MAG: hypothetical protein ACOZAA_09230 [Pseudomonadota bacterium]